MRVWSVEMNPGVAPDWPDCDVLACRRHVGNVTALVVADEAAARAIRASPGVTSVEPARDGRYVDDDGAAYEVSGRGTWLDRIS